MNILDSIIPIIVNKDKPEHIGSGILLRISNRVFILTAAHVLDDTIISNLLIPTKDGLIPFQGFASCVPIQNDINREDDFIDVAFYQFCSNWQHSFDLGLKPLNILDINITDIAYENDRYSFIGFPCKKSKIRDNQFIGELYRYSGGHIDESQYADYSLNPESNIVIKFNRRKNPDGILPLPNGISGGGIFAWPKDSDQNDDSKIKLVGICHTYHENKNIMIGTTINFLISSLIHFNQDLFVNVDELKQFSYQNRSIPFLIGFAYYRKEQWQQIRNIMNDKHIMAETWEEWRMTIERGLTAHFNDGIQVLRIILDIKELLVS